MRRIEELKRTTIPRRAIPLLKDMPPEFQDALRRIGRAQARETRLSKQDPQIHGAAIHRARADAFREASLLFKSAYAYKRTREATSHE